jgi:hypothetical protein
MRATLSQHDLTTVSSNESYSSAIGIDGMKIQLLEVRSFERTDIQTVDKLL